MRDDGFRLEDGTLRADLDTKVTTARETSDVRLT
jgi:hypothetical protein